MSWPNTIFVFVAKKPTDPYIIEFGKNLRKLRIQQGLSQEKLAINSDVSFNQVGRIERGEIEAKLIMIKRMAEGLGVHVKSLFEF